MGQKNYVQEEGDRDQRDRHPGQLGARQPAPGKPAARAASKHQQKNNHGQGISGMSQEKHESLNKGNLHQNVAQTDGNKIEQRQGRVAHPARVQGQWQDQEPPHRKQRDYQYQQQNQHSEVYLPVHGSLQIFLAENLAELQSKKEEWSVVVDGRDVIGVLPGKSIRIVAGDQIAKRIAARLRRTGQGTTARG